MKTENIETESQDSRTELSLTSVSVAECELELQSSRSLDIKKQALELRNTITKQCVQRLSATFSLWNILGKPVTVVSLSVFAYLAVFSVIAGSLFGTIISAIVLIPLSLLFCATRVYSNLKSSLQIVFGEIVDTAIENTKTLVANTLRQTSANHRANLESEQMIGNISGLIQKTITESILPIIDKWLAKKFPIASFFVKGKMKVLLVRVSGT